MCSGSLLGGERGWAEVALWCSLLHQEEPEQEGLEAEQGEEEEEDGEKMDHLDVPAQLRCRICIVKGSSKIHHCVCGFWVWHKSKLTFLKLTSIVIVRDLFNVQINCIKQYPHTKPSEK